MRRTLIIHRPITTLLLCILAGVMFGLGLDPYSDLTGENIVYFVTSFLLACVAAFAATDLL